MKKWVELRIIVYIIQTFFSDLKALSFQSIFLLFIVHMLYQPTIRFFPLGPLYMLFHLHVTFSERFLLITLSGQGDNYYSTFLFSSVELLPSSFSSSVPLLCPPLTSLEVICKLISFFFFFVCICSGLFFFHQFMSLSLYQYCVVFITVTSQQVLEQKHFLET